MDYPNKIIDILSKPRLNQKLKNEIMIIAKNSSEEIFSKITTFIEKSRITKLDKEKLISYLKGDQNISHYGEIARTNGLEFEKELVLYFRNNKEALIEKLKAKFPDLENDGTIECYGQDKVNSIYDKKTTRKADIYYKTNKYQIGISVKMSDRGTQIQIISLDNFILYLEHNNIKMTPKQKVVFEKFLGIITPSEEEMKSFNIKRNKKLVGKERYWFNEIQESDTKRTLDFLKTHYDKILEFIFCEGMCFEQRDKAEFFIFNQSYYTGTKKIMPKIYSKDELFSFVSGEPKITKDGNLELSKFIGLQRKGSGSISSANCLQFKDRGISKK